MKPEKVSNIPQLVRAAQFAGADENSQEFWRQVAAHTEHRSRERAALVQPRKLNLTERPKSGTI